MLRTSAARQGIATSDIDAAFFGLPGYGEASGDIEQLDAVPGGVLGHDRYSCDNDMVCGWAGSLAGEDGINVISGTGSMTYGERQGVGHRVGGWGELFGDEGSAYWIAAQGLNAFSRMSDGRLPHGPLHAMLKERLQVAGDLDVVSLVIDTWKGNRSKIAALATTVDRGRATPATRSASASCPRRSTSSSLLIETTRDADRIHRRGGRAGVLLRRHVQVHARLSRTASSPRWTCRPPSYDLRLRCSIQQWAPHCTPPSTADIR